MSVLRVAVIGKMILGDFVVRYEISFELLFDGKVVSVVE